MERGTVPSCGLCTRVAPQPGGASRHIASRHHQSRQSHCRPPPSSLPLPPAPPPTHLRVEYEHRHVVVERGGIGPGLAVVAVEGLELDVTACTGKGGGGTPGKEGGCALQGVCQWLPHQIVGIHSQTLSIAPTPVGHVISLGHPQLSWTRHPHSPQADPRGPTCTQDAVAGLWPTLIGVRWTYALTKASPPPSPAPLPHP